MTSRNKSGCNFRDIDSRADWEASVFCAAACDDDVEVVGPTGFEPVTKRL
jgi:hypothetical protein